jgi:hypothetical protein
MQACNTGDRKQAKSRKPLRARRLPAPLYLFCTFENLAVWHPTQRSGTRLTACPDAWCGLPQLCRGTRTQGLIHVSSSIVSQLDLRVPLVPFHLKVTLATNLERCPALLLGFPCTCSANLLVTSCRSASSRFNSATYIHLDLRSQLACCMVVVIHAACCSRSDTSTC